MARWYRSRIFQFGFAGLLMILATWTHSVDWKMHGELARQDYSSVIMLGHSRGRIDFTFSWSRDVSPASPWRLRGSLYEMEPGQKLSMFRMPLGAWEKSEPCPPDPEDPFSGDEHGGYFFRLALPHWLLMLAYLAGWWGLARSRASGTGGSGGRYRRG